MGGRVWPAGELPVPGTEQEKEMKVEGMDEGGWCTPKQLMSVLQ